MPFFLWLGTFLTAIGTYFAQAFAFLMTKSSKQIAVYIAYLAGTGFIIKGLIDLIISVLSTSIDPPELVVSLWGLFMPTNATTVFVTYISVASSVFIARLAMKAKDMAAKIFSN